MGTRTGAREPGRGTARRRLLHLTGRGYQRQGGAEAQQDGLRGNRPGGRLRRVEGRLPNGEPQNGSGRLRLQNSWGEWPIPSEPTSVRIKVSSAFAPVMEG